VFSSIILLCFITYLSASSCSGAPCGPDTETLLAFPTAQGYGAYSKGGRGGKVLFVSNLNDSGAGSLRDALEVQNEARIIVFRVSGTIRLASNIKISSPFVTIAGQTAFGSGVCLRGGGIVIQTYDVIIRHLCIRPGGSVKNAHLGDGIAFNNASNSIVDHVSVSWTTDESLQAWYKGTINNTVQYSIFSEPLNSNKLRPDQNHPHGYGPIFGNNGKNFSFHHNLIANAQRRNPRVSNFSNVDIVNNIIFNFGSSGSLVQDAKNRIPSSNINIIGNYYIYNGGVPPIEVRNIKSKRSIYINANKRYLGRNVNNVYLDLGSINAISDTQTRAVFNIEVENIESSWRDILGNLGANKPMRDLVDQRLFHDIEKRKGMVIDCVDKEELPNHLLNIEDCKVESSFGKWPEYGGNSVIIDEDKDGIDDTWEIIHGLDPTNPNDSSLDSFGFGYSNIETYINSLAGDNVNIH
jgi:pectate lyase